MLRPTVIGLFLASALGAAGQTAPDATPTPTPAPDSPREMGGDVKLYSEASLRLHRQDHGAALELFQSLLDGYPQSPLAPEALFWSGACQEKLGRPEEAKRSWAQLQRRFPDSPWCQDAKKRQGTPVQGPVQQQTWRLRLADGSEATGRLLGLEREAVRIDGRTAPWGEVRELVRDGDVAGEPDLLLLEGGDRLSARIVRADPEGIDVEAPAYGKVRLPRGRVARVELGSRGPGPVFGYSFKTPEGQFKLAQGEYGKAMQDFQRAVEVEPNVLFLGGGDDGEDEGGGRVKKARAEGRAILLEEGDDPVVILNQDKDGKDVRVVIRKADGEDAHRCVVVVRPKDGEEQRFELKLDGLDLGGDLDGLTKRIEEEVQKRVGDLDLDLKLDLDGVEKALREVPEEAREKVREVLRKKMKDGGEKLDKAKIELKRAMELNHEHLAQARRAAEEATQQAHEHVMKLRTLGGDGQQFYGLAQPGRLANDVFTWAGGVERRKDADRVVLENGDVLSGDLVDVTGDKVHMKTSWGELAIDRKQVARILFRGGDEQRKTTTRLFGQTPVPAIPPMAPVPGLPGAPRANTVPAARPFLGVTPGEHDGDGVVIEEVHAGTPAEEAGLQKGDVIRELDGTQIHDPGQLIELLGKKKVGDEITITFGRGEDTLKRRVKLAARARTAAGPSAPAPPVAPAPPTPPAPPAPPRVKPAPTPPTPPTPAPRRPRRTTNEPDEEKNDADSEGPRHF